MSEYVALVPIQAPGTLVMAYRPGDPVAADVVTEWGLGEDQVRPEADYEAPRPVEDSEDRAAWEAYVIGQGTSVEDARAASLEDLRDMYEPPAEPETPVWVLNDEKETQERVAAAGSAATPVSAPVPVSDPDRPADSAVKADWVAYVIDQGGDRAWAEDSSTTKEDLKNWRR